MKINNYHILGIAITSFPVYWAAAFYLDAVGVAETESVASAVTICFLVFVYIGRYFAQPLGDRFNSVQNLQIILSVIIAATGLWLFVHADYPFRHQPALNLLSYWLPFIALSMAAGILVKLTRLSQSRLDEANRSAIQSKSELQLLQSQLSPHFLFNTLNNLYGISITRHEKMPGLLLKLSELLRYSVYEAKELYVPLRDEISYINNYIDFEKIRLGDRLVISSSIEGIDGDLKIVPMILIVFIENAFKHSKNSTDQNIYIDIELKTWANSILFAVKNSRQDNGESKSAEKYSGFGLENVRRRLELMYRHRYDLKTEIKEDSYSVMLQLKTT